jgi:hypothetical protein
VAMPDPDDEPSEDWHSCPFAEEIHGNYDKNCKCSVNQTRECALDI